ncbi:MAG: hypothetical protein SOW59_01965 [Corynebacterium sp.]|nr:hypothetical protein [Corynebacterium sp.]
MIDAVLSAGTLQPPRDTVLTDAMGALVSFEGVVREVQESHPHMRLWVGRRVGEMKIGDVVFVVLAAPARRWWAA